MALAAAPLFVVGLAEDCTKRVGVKTRLAFAFIAGVLGFYLADAKITHLDLPILDPMLTIGFVSLCFTAFAITRVAYAALWMIGAVLGFFLWNYPKGLIF